MAILHSGPVSDALRAALYVRVSTEHQAEKYGLQAQITVLQERARDRGYVRAGDGDRDVFADDGYTGGDLHRPALERLRTAVRDGLVDVVLCLDPDRLSRNLSDLLVLADEWDGAGVRLEFMTQDRDASPEGRLFFAVRGAVAEFEKAKIRERMMRGKHEKARQGKVVNPGTLPMWLRSADGGATVTCDPVWTSHVQQVFRWYVDEGLTLRAIAQRLTDLGIATPTGGHVWQPNVIRNWLKSPAAKGTFPQFRYRAVVPQQRKVTTRGRRVASSMGERPPEEWVWVPVPAIVDERVWDAAQTRLRDNRDRSPRNVRRFYLLRGLVLCGHCGRRMAGIYLKDRHRRIYRCGSRTHGPRVDGRGACNMRDADAARIDEQVWALVAAALGDPALLAAELTRRTEATEPLETAETLTLYQGRLVAIGQEMTRLTVGFQKGLIPDDIMATQMEELRSERGRVAELVRNLDAERTQAEQDCTRLADVVAFAQEIGAGLEALTDSERQTIVQLLVRDVVVTPERVLVNAHFPVPNPGEVGDQLCSHTPDTIFDEHVAAARRGPGLEDIPPHDNPPHVLPPLNCRQP